MRKEVISFKDPTDENWKSTEIKKKINKNKKCNQKRNQRKENSVLLKDFVLKKYQNIFRKSYIVSLTTHEHASSRSIRTEYIL